MSPSTGSDDLATILTERQLEIACLLASGLSRREIARTHCISEATVHEHIRHIFAKKAIHREVDLITAVIRSGICDEEK